MTRKLPWLSGTPATKAVTFRGTKDTSQPAKRMRFENPTADSEHDLDRVSQQRFGQQDTSNRSMPGPPEDHFMIEGLENDDKYRMVEDEFMDVAKLYTQHLHAQEYKRVIDAARLQNVNTIRTISGHATQSMTAATKCKAGGAPHAKQHASNVTSLIPHQESSNDEGSAWIGTCLHGLMDNPKRDAANLTDIRDIPATRSAVAEFVESKTVELANRRVSLSPEMDKSRRRTCQGAVPQYQQIPLSMPELTPLMSYEDVETDDDLDAPVIKRLRITNASLKPTEPKPSSSVARAIPQSQDIDCGLSQAARERAMEVARRIELRREMRFKNERVNHSHE